MAMDDLLVLFLTKVRLGTPYYALSKQFGVDTRSAQREILRALRTFNDSIGKRLFHLQHADTVRANLPQDWPERFKDTLLIGDGYPKAIKKSGTFVIQRITWSVYKHANIFLTVICRLLHRFVCVDLPNMFLLVISPDGLIQMCSSTYGGQSAEVTTIINDSKIVDRIRGISWFGLVAPFVIFIISYGSDGVFEG